MEWVIYIKWEKLTQSTITTSLDSINEIFIFIATTVVFHYTLAFVINIRAVFLSGNANGMKNIPSTSKNSKVWSSNE